eukprot:1185568-Prorocentrum_minimum.AAC.6
MVARSHITRLPGAHARVWIRAPRAGASLVGWMLVSLTRPARQNVVHDDCVDSIDRICVS